jgi:hypothetical protein
LLLHLTAAAAASGSLTVVASSRDLEVATKTARRAIVRALDALETRGLIATRQGTPRSPAAHLLRFLEVAQIPKGGGVFGTPPLPVEKSGQAVFLEHLSGAIGTPPPTENQQLPAIAAAVDSEGVITLGGIIDRLARAKAKGIDPSILAAARRFLHGYRCKFPPQDEVGKPHPPDDRITAQFLSMGDGSGGWPRLERMLYDLMAERKTAGSSYAWFVTVAAQRIHGIDPQMLKRKRAELRLIRDRQREDAARNEPPSAQQLNAAIAAAAGAKRLL